MKKFIGIMTAAVFLVAASHKAEAQSFEKGNVLIGAGYGFGNFLKTGLKIFKPLPGYSFSSLGPIYGKVEYGVSDNIGLGINFAYVTHHAKWTFNNPTTGNPYTAHIDRIGYSANARLNYHFANGEKIDPYVGVGMGYRSAIWDIGDDDAQYDPEDLVTFMANNQSKASVGFETTVGVRYYPIPTLGIFGEVGMAKSFLQFGVNYRLAL
jgi:opacity protein-like surface antigen